MSRWRASEPSRQLCGRVLQDVADALGLSVEELARSPGKGWGDHCSEGRQLVFWILVEMGHSYAGTARVLGFDHTSIRTQHLDLQQRLHRNQFAARELVHKVLTSCQMQHTCAA